MTIWTAATKAATAWTAATKAVTAWVANIGFLLKEDGGYLLLENGGKIILHSNKSSTSWTSSTKH
jgi:hypothetical protein